MIFDDKLILSLRGDKNQADPRVPYSSLIEKETDSSGNIEDVITIFLTNSECPFRCLMCDLWKNTTDQHVKSGDIPFQIQSAINTVGSATNIKLYNSGNFFDTKAIPPGDYKEIADIIESFKTVTVESHPKLITDTCLDFAEMLKPGLEVAIGLETVHPDILPKLNKRMSLDDFENSVRFLKTNDISSRAFILLKTPFMTESEGVDWAKRSIEFAFDCGVECCAVIPTRKGNGTIDKLMVQGNFSEPSIESLEEVLEFGIGLRAGRVFADLWDLERFSKCDECFEVRKDRLHQMNLNQYMIPTVSCSC